MVNCRFHDEIRRPGNYPAGIFQVQQHHARRVTLFPARLPPVLATRRIGVYGMKRRQPSLRRPNRRCRRPQLGVGIGNLLYRQEQLALSPIPQIGRVREPDVEQLAAAPAVDGEGALEPHVLPADPLAAAVLEMVAHREAVAVNSRPPTSPQSWSGSESKARATMDRIINAFPLSAAHHLPRAG